MDRLIDLCWNLDTMPQAGVLNDATTRNMCYPAVIHDKSDDLALVRVAHNALSA